MVVCESALSWACPASIFRPPRPYPSLCRLPVRLDFGATPMLRSFFAAGVRSGAGRATDHLTPPPRPLGCIWCPPPIWKPGRSHSRSQPLLPMTVDFLVSAALPVARRRSHLPRLGCPPLAGMTPGRAAGAATPPRFPSPIPPLSLLDLPLDVVDCPGLPKLPPLR